MKNDLISRQKLLEELNGLEPEGFGESIAGMVAIHKIQEAPSVDATPVVYGRWVELPSMAPEYECSECGQSYEWWEASEANYCPNCGAKMDGGDNR